jgi:hypothetical protein
MKKKWFGAVLAAIVVAATGVSAEAQTSARAGSGDWQFEVTPYVWMVGLDGNISANDKDVDFDQSFSDLVENVDAGGSVLGVAQYQKYVGFVQADYFSLSYNNDDFDSRAADFLEEVDIDQTFLTLGVGYQFPGFVDNSWIDVMAAARMTDLKIDVKSLGNRSEDKSTTIWDPALVVRPCFILTDNKKFRFNPTLSIGGGGDSDLIYELQPQFQYDFTETIAARLGYRRLYY